MEMLLSVALIAVTALCARAFLAAKTARKVHAGDAKKHQTRTSNLSGSCRFKASSPTTTPLGFS